MNDDFLLAEAGTAHPSSGARLRAIGQAMRFAAALTATRLLDADIGTALHTLRDAGVARQTAWVRFDRNAPPQILASTAASGADAHEIAMVLEDVDIPALLSRSIGPGAGEIYRTPDARLHALERGHGARTCLVCVLGRGSDPATLELLLNQAAQIWSANAPRLQSGDDHDQELPDGDILGGDNPYGLTKSEQKVCRRIREGERPASIALGSGKSIATVRTHLRNVYAKTGADGLVSLTHRLATPKGGAAQARRQ